MASQQQSGRAASRARRQLQVNGKGRSAAASAPTRQSGRARKPVPAAAANPAPTAPTVAAAPVATPAPTYNATPKRATKSASRLRRETLASRGKSGDRSSDRQRTKDMAMRNSNAATHYWTMWKLPFFGETDLNVVMSELETCRREYPDHHIRLTGYDNYTQSQGVNFVVFKAQGGSRAW